MALFGPVERRNPVARLVHGTVYLVLAAGSLSMAYPFLLMLGASVTTDLDFDDWRIVPAYLRDDTALYRKWLDDRYGNAFNVAKRVHRLDVSSFRYLEHIPPYGVNAPAFQRRVDDWLNCVQTVPPNLLQAFYIDDKRTRPTHQKLTAWLSSRYEGDIEALNRKHDTAYTQFSEVTPTEFALSHKSRPEAAEMREEYLEFRKTLPPEELMPSLASYGLRAYAERHIGTIDQLNEYLGTAYEGMDDVIFPPQRPVEPGPWRDLWDLYVRKRFPLSLVRVEGDFDEAFRAFLRAEHRDYDGRVRAHNAEHGTDFPPLSETKYSPVMPTSDLNFADWIQFTDDHVPASAKRATTIEGLWRGWLREEYGTLSAVNEAHGLEWTDWSAALPPLAETDLWTFRYNKDAIRKEFFLRNYRLVMDYILFHGRAVLNTFILVTMVVLGHLTVQPLAAYGLSRFNLRYSHQILLFLLATMAFPQEVAMIPNFLLIKELGLLNTYWALVLPGLASGMGIFLLKGYFDSLPTELYEAAMMDGAGELRMFLQITVPLSKPILAVIALGSFAGAYGGFMWAFLICQKPHMWTMMVFLWQLGNQSYQSIWMAGLVIAAIPTLLVFIFCQKIILRGIIVPTMK
jgi:ABC-type glycerol-3-phosphate transport system permease component